MTLVRAIGWVMLFPAILVLAYGLVLWRDGVPVFEIAAGEYLARTGPADADPLQVAARTYIPGALADPLSMPVLLWPVAGALALVAGLVSVPGTVILVLFRRGWSRALVRRQYTR